MISEAKLPISEAKFVISEAKINFHTLPTLLDTLESPISEAKCHFLVVCSEKCVHVGDPREAKKSE